MQNKQSITISTFSFDSLCWITWLVFLILKVTNVLPDTFTWFWLPFALMGVVFIIGVIIGIIAYLIDK